MATGSMVATKCHERVETSRAERRGLVRLSLGKEVISMLGFCLRLKVLYP